MNRLEKSLPGVDPRFAKRAVDKAQPAEDSLRNVSALPDLFKDAFVNQIKELRNDRERCDLALLQSAQQLSRVQRLEINNPRSRDQWKKQIRHLGERVKQRQQTKQGIVGAEAEQRENTVCLATQIVMRQHHAFGVGGGSGGVKQRSDRV